MEKVIMMTEAEYEDLLKKVNSSDGELEYLRACEMTLNAFCCPTRICPSCGKAMLLEGYLCPNCGYDDSDYEE